MGFIKAFAGALKGTFADQWKDFYTPKTGVSETAAIFQAVPKAQNNGVGENTKGFNNIISNGSKIVVPEGTALITIQDGAITGFIAEPGGYEFRSNDPNSQSIFAGAGAPPPPRWSCRGASAPRPAGQAAARAAVPPCGR